MSFFPYRTAFVLFLFFLMNTPAFGQDIKPDKIIKLHEHESAHVCILHPTDINAHYKFAPDNWRNKKAAGASTSEFEITYLNDCSGGSWPDDARNAFEYAASIWESHLDSPVPIRIEANWVPLPSNTLGSANPTNVLAFSEDEGGPFLPNTWYAIAQASAMSGADFVNEYDDIEYDIVVNMNCEFEDWYLGTDANPPANTLDAVTVLLHEIGHGIGFFGSMRSSDNNQIATWGIGEGYPVIYDQFAVDGEFDRLLDTSIYPRSSERLYDALTGNFGGVFFSGPDAQFAFDDMRVPLYSPEPFAQGQSYSHFDQEVFSESENALMRPFLDQALAVHSPGPVFCGLLEDMGWPLGQACIDLLPEEGFLARPILTLPPNGSYNFTISPVLQWHAVPGATEYRVQLSTDFEFNDLVLDETVMSTVLAVDEELEFNTLYFWRVQALSGGGNSNFSTKHRFTTTTNPPDAVTLFTPDNGETDLRPGFMFTWQPGERAEEYQIQISENADFSDLVIESTVSTPRFGATQGLDFSTTYYWRVRGVNTAGAGAWSEVRTLTTIIEKPDPVSLITPTENENQVPVSGAFNWTESERASEYIIQISLNENFTSEGLIELTSSEPMATLSNPLEFATIYYWRVKATNIGGESAWSEANRFTTVVRETAIAPNYPNPFNSSTTIRFQLSENVDVSLDIFDTVGRRVSVLVDEERPAGVYFEQLHAARFASGTYFIRIVAGDFMEVQKMAIIK